MRVESRDDVTAILRGEARSDLACSYLAQLDTPPFMFGGYPLYEEITASFSKPNRLFLGASRVPLPESEHLEADLVNTLMQRRSVRDFSEEAPSLSNLSTLLWWSVKQIDGDIPTGFRRRPYPSGGALYPVETYLLVRNVKQLSPGAYHYDPINHELERLRSESVTYGRFFYDCVEDVDETPPFRNASFLLLLVSYMRKSFYKYGDKAWRLMLLEGGHIAQNIYLVASAMGSLGVCGLGGGYRQDRFADLLGLDGHSELVVYPIIAGKPV